MKVSDLAEGTISSVDLNGTHILLSMIGGRSPP